MSGVPNPVFPIVEAFAINADPQYIEFPIPIPDPTLTDPGAASFDLGFGPLNMTDPAAGGIPPRGKDFNGLFRMITQYSALMQAGQIVPFDATAAAAFTGYKVGAVVASIASPGFTWTNYLDGNVNDPDSVTTGWASNFALLAALAPAAGQLNNVVLPGASDFYMEIDTTAGNVDFSGFVAQRNGQKLIISNTGANLLQILANSLSSTAANRIRTATDLALVQNQTLTIQWFSGIARWLLP